MSTLNKLLFYRRSKRHTCKLSPLASWPRAMIYPKWHELPMSKDVRAIEPRLYLFFFFFSESGTENGFCINNTIFVIVVTIITAVLITSTVLTTYVTNKLMERTEQLRKLGGSDVTDTTRISTKTLTETNGGDTSNVSMNSCDVPKTDTELDTKKDEGKKVETDKDTLSHITSAGGTCAGNHASPIVLCSPKTLIRKESEFKANKTSSIPQVSTSSAKLGLVAGCNNFTHASSSNTGYMVEPAPPHMRSAMNVTANTLVNRNRLSAMLNQNLPLQYSSLLQGLGHQSQFRTQWHHVTFRIPLLLSSVKLQWLEHRCLVYRGWFDLVLSTMVFFFFFFFFFFDNSRKQVLGIF